MICVRIKCSSLYPGGSLDLRGASFIEHVGEEGLGAERGNDAGTNRVERGQPGLPSETFCPQTISHKNVPNEITRAVGAS